MTTAVLAGRQSRLGAPLRGRVVVALGVLLGPMLALLAQAPFITEPIDMDEGIYFTVAGSGALPYVEAFDHKPPLIFAWYKLALILNSDVASGALIHSMAAVVMGATALLVYLIGRAIAGHQLGVAASVIFALLGANQYLALNANTEVFAMLPLAGAVLAFLGGRRTGSRSLFAVAGALAALSVLTRTSMAFSAIALALSTPVAGGNRVGGSRLAALAAMSSAGLAVLVCAALPWILNGDFGVFWHANVSFNSAYALPLGGERATRAAAFGALVAIGWAWAIALAGVGLGAPGRNEDRLLILGLLLGGVVAVVWTGYGYVHYWAQLMLPLSLLAGLGAGRLFGGSRLKPIQRLGRLGLAALTAYSFLFVLPVYTASPQEAHARKFRTYEGEEDRSALTYRVGERLRELAKQGERMFVLGTGGELYALSGIRPATRVFINSHYRHDPATADEALAQIGASLPSLIVDTTIGFRPEIKPHYVHPGMHAEVSLLLAERYELVATVPFAGRDEPFARIYRLREAGAPATAPVR